MEQIVKLTKNTLFPQSFAVEVSGIESVDTARRLHAAMVEHTLGAVTPAPVPEPLTAEVINECTHQYIQANLGNKIMQIKFVRTLTGWGLKEAKDYIDNFVHIPVRW